MDPNLCLLQFVKVRQWRHQAHKHHVVATRLEFNGEPDNLTFCASTLDQAGCEHQNAAGPAGARRCSFFELDLHGKTFVRCGSLATSESVRYVSGRGVAMVAPLIAPAMLRMRKNTDTAIFFKLRFRIASPVRTMATTNAYPANHHGFLVCSEAASPAPPTRMATAGTNA